jgi:hypothetical protein
MLSKFLKVPIRCLLSLGLAFLISVPDIAFSAQSTGVSKLNLVIVEGEGAINNVRQRTAREPIVQVEDENHRPLAGAAVIFTLPDSGPSGTFAHGSRTLQVMTNSKGQAVAKGLRLNDVTGKFQIQVEASYKGATATTTINQANAVLSTAASGGGIFSTVIGILAAAASAVAIGVILSVTKGGGSSRSPNDNPTGDYR